MTLTPRKVRALVNMACVLPCFGQSLCLSGILVFRSLCVYKYIRLGCNYLCINPFNQPCSFREHVKHKFGQILVQDCIVFDSEPRRGNAPLTMSLCARVSCNGPPCGNVWPLCCQSILGWRRPRSGKVTDDSYSSETFPLPSFFSLQIQYWVSCQILQLRSSMAWDWLGGASWSPRRG